MGNLIGRAREAEELNRLYISEKIYDKEGAVENFAGAHKTYFCAV